ncbi:serine/threonine-protein kinase [Spongiactinospora rosea]|nr:serine/threonine-protein kinase [Spongiactinospora rosea]
MSEGQRSERVVAKRYHLLEPIGRGGMGVVWAAHDDLLDRRVAVKEVRYAVALGDEVQQLNRRTLREARAAARLSHPNVVVVHDVIEEDGRPWIVMQLVPSRSLGQVIKQEGPLLAQRAAKIGLEVVSALRSAHKAGVLHRDVKPENVLLADDGRVVLTDFGIATLEAETQLTMTGLAGTPAFIAPERLRGRPARRESDLWSLGATLYAAVEGRPPHDRGTPLATMHSVLTDAPDPAPHAGPLLPVIEGLLLKEPVQRLSHDEATRMLRQVLDGGNPTRIMPAIRPVQRRPGPGPAQGPGRTPVPPPPNRAGGPQRPAAPYGPPADAGRQGAPHRPAPDPRRPGNPYGPAADAARQQPPYGPAQDPAPRPAAQPRPAPAPARPTPASPPSAPAGGPPPSAPPASGIPSGGPAATPPPAARGSASPSAAPASKSPAGGPKSTPPPAGSESGKPSSGPTGAPPPAVPGGGSALGGPPSTGRPAPEQRASAPVPPKAAEAEEDAAQGESPEVEASSEPETKLAVPPVSTSGTEPGTSGLGAFEKAASQATPGRGAFASTSPPDAPGRGAFGQGAPPKGYGKGAFASPADEEAAGGQDDAATRRRPPYARTATPKPATDQAATTKVTLSEKSGEPADAKSPTAPESGKPSASASTAKGKPAGTAKAPESGTGSKAGKQGATAKGKAASGAGAKTAAPAESGKDPGPDTSDAGTAAAEASAVSDAATDDTSPDIAPIDAEADDTALAPSIKEESGGSAAASAPGEPADGEAPPSTPKAAEPSRSTAEQGGTGAETAKPKAAGPSGSATGNEENHSGATPGKPAKATPKAATAGPATRATDDDKKDKPSAASGKSAKPTAAAGKETASPAPKAAGPSSDKTPGKSAKPSKAVKNVAKDGQTARLDPVPEKRPSPKKPPAIGIDEELAGWFRKDPPRQEPPAARTAVEFPPTGPRPSFGPADFPPAPPPGDRPGLLPGGQFKRAIPFVVLAVVLVGLIAWWLGMRSASDGGTGTAEITSSPSSDASGGKDDDKKKKEGEKSKSEQGGRQSVSPPQSAPEKSAEPPKSDDKSDKEEDEDPKPDTKAPEGWWTYKNERGFSIALPKGWSAYQEKGRSVWFHGPGTAKGSYLLIEEAADAGSDPYKDWVVQEKSARKSFRGYKIVKIEKVDYMKAAADWEFTWQLKSDRARVRNRGFVTDGGKGYALYWHTKADSWKKDLSFFDTFARTFQPAK